MFDSTLDTYLEKVDPTLAPTVAALHHAVMTARRDLTVKISLNMLMYALNGDYRHWVTSLGATSDTVTLRFLVGSLMRDPEAILRRGTGGIRTVDFRTAEDVDAAIVGAYVHEAAVQLGAYRGI